MVRRRRDAALLFSWAAGPVAAMANQIVSYAMAQNLTGTTAMHALTVVAVVVTVAGGVVALVVLREVGREHDRAAFMATGGLLLSAIALLVILAQEVYKLYAPWSAPP
jgi:hypothetical protein